MALIVRSITLHNFRNIHTRTIDFDAGMNVLIGSNATGKTNTLEAIQLVTTGVSFRHAALKNLIYEGENHARITARLEGDERVLSVGCDITPEHKRYTLNGKRTAAAQLTHTLPSILFNPDDLALVKGPAAQRRREIDSFAAQVHTGYKRILSSYTKGVEQRNKLLRDEWCDRALLDAWDESIAVGAGALIHARVHLLNRLMQAASQSYATIANQEQLSCSYTCSIDIDPTQASREEIAHAMRTALRMQRAHDMQQGTTSVGPHHDDILFEINKHSARLFGSQGQQRSIVLALKIAEVEVTQAITHTPPLLLLDDVMSELDEKRREAVSGIATRGVQTIVTTTNMGYFTDTGISSAQVVRFGE